MDLAKHALAQQRKRESFSSVSIEGNDNDNVDDDDNVDDFERCVTQVDSVHKKET